MSEYDVDFTCSIDWFRYRGEWRPWVIAFSNVRRPREVNCVVPTYQSMIDISPDDFHVNCYLDSFPWRRDIGSNVFETPIQEMEEYLTDVFYPVVLELPASEWFPRYSTQCCPCLIGSDEPWTVRYLREDVGFLDVVHLADTH